MYIAYVERSWQDQISFHCAGNIYRKCYGFAITTFLVTIVEHLLLGRSDLRWTFHLTVFKNDEFLFKSLRSVLIHCQWNGSTICFKMFSASCVSRTCYSIEANKIIFLTKAFLDVLIWEFQIFAYLPYQWITFLKWYFFHCSCLKYKHKLDVDQGCSLINLRQRHCFAHTNYTSVPSF